LDNIAYNGLNTARYNLVGSGTQASRISNWWETPGSPVQQTTEEWTGAGAAVTKTITVS
jgi:hypothetical protein